MGIGTLLSKVHLPKDVEKDILGGVKQTLTLARGPLGLVPIPALPVAIDAVLAIISAVEKASGNKKHLKELGLHLQTLVTYVLTPITSAVESTSGYVVTVRGDVRLRINTLSGQLTEIAKEANKLANYNHTRHFLRNVEFSGALKDLNIKINNALMAFRVRWLGT